MKKMLLLFSLVAVFMGTKAQIGYQISLLNMATGEPRANETVTVSVSLSNNANEVFYTETKSASTNDFGVLSLSIGNADTFRNVDLSKMPFFIEVTANGVMIGKSQILSVPVAEVAKRVVPIDRNLILGVWESQYWGYKYVFKFDENGTGETYEYSHVPGSDDTWKIYEGHCGSFVYELEGDSIYCYLKEEDGSDFLLILRYFRNKLYPTRGDYGVFAKS